MLTDDLLTEELGTAFRDATAGMSYAGPVPSPSRAPLLLVPAAAAGVAAVVLVAGSLGDAPPAAAPGTASGPSASARPQLVTDTISFAGYTFRYQRGAEQTDPLRAEVVLQGLPTGVTEVALAGPARAWVGTDPRSGDNALYVQAPTRNHGKLFALISSTWSRAQLVHLVRTGRPNG
jgi:hypothetical protein